MSIEREKHYEETFVDAKSKDNFPLRLMIGNVIELQVRFPGGYFNVFGRVSIVPASPCLRVDRCRLGVDVLVHRESLGEGFVYDPKD